MASWVVALIGVTIVGGLIVVARRWGISSAKNKRLKENVEAARTRKEIDNEIQKLTPDELADRLRRGL